MGVWVNGVDITELTINNGVAWSGSPGDILRVLDKDVAGLGDFIGRVRTSLSCRNCGEEVSQYGPETFHTDSTMIRCNPAKLDDINAVSRAEVKESDIHE